MNLPPDANYPFGCLKRRGEGQQKAALGFGVQNKLLISGILFASAVPIRVVVANEIIPIYPKSDELAAE